MSEMIERVARAICAAKGDDPDEPCEDWMTEFSGWRGYQESASAAIEAMRDPTEAMITAARATDLWDISVPDSEPDRVHVEETRKELAAAFGMMIAEALK